MSRAASLMVALAVVSSCADTDPPEPLAAPGPLAFRDVTAASGLAGLWQAPPDATQIVEVKGGGLGLLDHDGDGDLDLFVPGGASLEAPNSGTTARLLANEGELVFRDVTDAVQLDDRRWGMGVAVGDVEGDGDDDIYVTAFGPNGLLVNEGGVRLQERGAAGGVDDDRWSTGCAFGDVDDDGDLDLYVANYLEFDPSAPPPGDRFKGVAVFGGPLGLSPLADALFLNDGQGSFADVTVASGCAAVPPSFGLGVAILDLDHDGRQEIVVGNDSMPNFLFDDAAPAEGDPTGAAGAAPVRRLVDRGALSGLSADGDGGHQATMGLAFADVDGNGFPDLFSSNFAADSNTLHLNDGGRLFDDRTGLYGLSADGRSLVGWAAAFLDADHDGDEDLVVVNGHTYPQATPESMDSAALQPPLYYAREGRRFRRLGVEEGGPWVGRPRMDRGLVCADLDGDGDLDLVVREREGPLTLLRNERAPGAWLVVALRDDRADIGNRRGLGARVVVRAGEREFSRWLVGGGGYLSSGAPEVHVGLGPQEAPVEVEVTWPGGHRQVLRDVAPNRRLEIVRDA